ncbi:nuclear transport factor 2 family protein [Sphaerisporangium sp. TRM90804]|uniref:nuclear transport factor 2 family protein n=1 Tax=Sphaerisporangium sp. TRM90804 TaxID=3031113 RepID=UPI002447D127|nr:nuclear transport factor 2 family protein [Sphaerisporangium sp. TRM90804]MDH2428358.1 nuclear transport factor 2 family protein [Sphaerisporangium sp. TRM90804]
MTLTPNQLADRFVALWNEPDAERRRLGVVELYAPDATYVFYRRDPVHGHEAILSQITYTKELYGPMGYAFRSSHNAIGHHGVVRLNWVMVRAATGEMEMAGQDVVVLDEDGRIRTDYQFHDRLPSSFAYNDGYEEHGRATRPARPTPVRP